MGESKRSNVFAIALVALAAGALLAVVLRFAGGGAGGGDRVEALDGELQECRRELAVARGEMPPGVPGAPNDPTGSSVGANESPATASAQQPEATSADPEAELPGRTDPDDTGQHTTDDPEGVESARLAARDAARPADDDANRPAAAQAAGEDSGTAPAPRSRSDLSATDRPEAGAAGGAFAGTPGDSASPGDLSPKERRARRRAERLAQIRQQEEQRMQRRLEREQRRADSEEQAALAAEQRQAERERRRAEREEKARLASEQRQAERERRQAERDQRRAEREEAQRIAQQQREAERQQRRAERERLAALTPEERQAERRAQREEEARIAKLQREAEREQRRLVREKRQAEREEKQRIAEQQREAERQQRQLAREKRQAEREEKQRVAQQKREAERQQRQLARDQRQAEREEKQRIAEQQREAERQQRRLARDQRRAERAEQERLAQELREAEREQRRAARLARQQRAADGAPAPAGNPAGTQSSSSTRSTRAAAAPTEPAADAARRPATAPVAAARAARTAPPPRRAAPQQPGAKPSSGRPRLAGRTDDNSALARPVTAPPAAAIRQDSSSAGNAVTPAERRPASRAPAPGGVSPGSSTTGLATSKPNRAAAPGLASRRTSPGPRGENMARWLDYAKQRLLRDQPVAQAGPSGGSSAVNYTDIIAEFNRRVRRSGQAIERCHRGLVKRDTRFETETLRLKIALDLESSGRAANLSFSPDTNQQFETCMKTVSQLWRVKPHAAGTLRLQYPVTLVPIGGERPRGYRASDVTGSGANPRGAGDSVASADSESPVQSPGASIVGQSGATATSFEQYIEPVPEQSVVDRIVASLNRRVQRSQVRIRRCYERLLKQDSRTWSRSIALKMTLVVNPNGKVATSALAPDLGRSFNTCISTVVDTWSVRGFTGSSVLLQYQLELVPEDQPKSASSTTR